MMSLHMNDIILAQRLECYSVNANEVQLSDAVFIVDVRQTIAVARRKVVKHVKR